MGIANPPHTTSPSTSYKVKSTEGSTFSLSNNCKDTIIPLPAQPTPGSGPPVSTQVIPLNPAWTISSSLISSISQARTLSKIVSLHMCPKSNRVESFFGSQPIWQTFFPIRLNAAETFDAVVDLPIPPFP